MAVPFFRTLRALETDRSPWSAALLAASLLLAAAGLAWLLAGRVGVYVATGEARVEVDAAAHAVESPVAGRIVANRMVVGEVVAAGAVLVELDAAVETLELGEEETRLTAATRELLVLSEQVAELASGDPKAGQAGEAGKAEAQARLREAQAEARLAEEEAGRLERLHREGQVSEVELGRARAEAAKRRAAVEALTMASSRVSFAEQSAQSERRVRRTDVAAEMARLEGERDRAAAAVAVLAARVERHTIKAPAEGTVGEVAPLGRGAFVEEGERLGSIVPAGKLRVLASFPPQMVLGRVRPGQAARLRLEGFPWTEFGTVPAVVARVASELRDGRVRVELDVAPPTSSRIPLQHGLPGSVEIEVERVSPGILLLRAAGQLLAPRGELPVARAAAP